MILLNFSEATSHFHDLKHRRLDKEQLEGTQRLLQNLLPTLHSSVTGCLPADSMPEAVL